MDDHVIAMFVVYTDAIQIVVLELKKQVHFCLCTCRFLILTQRNVMCE